MAVRSARLAAGTSGTLGTETTLYTCPAGRTALLKDVRVSVAASGNTRTVLWLQSGAVRVSLVDKPMSEFETVERVGFMVLEPGDQLRVFASGAQARVWASGAELVGLA